MNILKRIAYKEFGSFFSSPMAFIFLGSFLAVTLFIFFWVDTFFARNITEIRGMFEWMPILLIFLTAAVTMRMWAEEHRSGSLEMLLTAPVKPVVLVAGKFLACLGLVILALLLTLPLPITVSLLGPLDWGPVLGGYAATIFLAAAYIAIGLYVSVKSENQIISLIVTSLICCLFYLVGSDAITSFFGNSGSEMLKLLGTGSRFESITRGVLDIRDIYYYLSITAIFLCLNVYGLEKIRWSGNAANSHHRSWQLASALLVLNLIVANFWLTPITGLRLDMTRQKIYSISDQTRNYLKQVKEPLLIRGYFSPQTHPLLAPLVPQLKDMLREYAIAGGKNVHVEFVNPQDNPDVESEAARKYGIRPVPFQTADKYQASVTNSYFNILIQYGDQFETLGFRDLIEVKAQNSQNIQVELRNPEYDVTKAIKKVLYGYQGGGDIFSTISKNIQLTGYFSPDQRLPKELVPLRQKFEEMAASLGDESKGKLSWQVINPEQNHGKVAQELSSKYGFKPMRASLLDRRTFWFYMTLTSGDQNFEIPLPENLNSDDLKRSITAGIKRFDKGFTKTVALSTPPMTPAMPQYGIPASGEQFNTLKKVLSQEHVITETSLKDGHVPSETDILLVVSPKNMNDKQIFAVDQFLMQGGTVIVSTSSFTPVLQSSVSVNPAESGFVRWLEHNGIDIDKTMVLDSQNSAFPIPVNRNVGGLTIRETHLLNYPYFVDIRADGMNENSGIVGGLNQLTMDWASPLEIDAAKNADRKVVRLLESSQKSWTSSSTNIQPDLRKYGELGFPVGKEQKRSLLGVMIQGSFSSYFADKESPLMQPAVSEAQTEKDVAKAKDGKQVIYRQVDKSPESSRIVVFSSSSFLGDTVLGISASVNGTSYLEPVQLIANTIDWATEDSGLMALRGRSHFSRPLLPMSREQQRFWEYLNYGLAVFGLLVIWLIKRIVKARREKRALAMILPAQRRV